MANKNSGRQSCKFMERKKCKNPYTNNYYTPTDFVKGKDIYINKYIFRLVDCDDYTKKYMIDNPEVYLDSSLDCVVKRLKTGAIRFDNKLDEFAIQSIGRLDPNSEGWINSDAIMQGFAE